MAQRAEMPPEFYDWIASALIARRRDRGRADVGRLLRLQCAGIKRKQVDQDEDDEVHAIGLRRRSRPPHQTPQTAGIGLFSHDARCARKGARREGLNDPLSRYARRSLGMKNRTASADRLRADETIRIPLPMTSMSRPKINGAMACAIRAGAPMMPSR